MVIQLSVLTARFLPRAGQTKFLTKGGEKDEENQAFMHQDTDGKKNQPSQADEKVNRPD